MTEYPPLDLLVSRFFGLSKEWITFRVVTHFDLTQLNLALKKVLTIQHVTCVQF